MRSRSAAAWLLVALALAFAGVNIAVTVHRSLIPVALDGVIERIELRREKNPGIDDVWLVDVAGRRLHVDAPVARQLSEGQRISKAAWERRLTVDGATVPLRLSREAVGMLWLMPLVLGSVAALLATRLRLRLATG